MKKGVKIDNNGLKKLKLFAPYEGKSKFSISFNKKIREQLKTCRKARNKIKRRVMLAKAIIIFGYHNMTKAYDAKYRYEMRRRCAKNGQ